MPQAYIRYIHTYILYLERPEKFQIRTCSGTKFDVLLFVWLVRDNNIIIRLGPPYIQVITGDDDDDDSTRSLYWIQSFGDGTLCKLVTTSLPVRSEYSVHLCVLAGFFLQYED